MWGCLKLNIIWIIKNDRKWSTHTLTHTQSGHFVLTGAVGGTGEGGEVSPDCCQSSSPMGGPRRQADLCEL